MAMLHEIKIPKQFLDLIIIKYKKHKQHNLINDNDYPVLEYFIKAESSNANNNVVTDNKKPKENTADRDKRLLEVAIKLYKEISYENSREDELLK